MEQTAKVPHAHVGALRQPLHGQIGVEVKSDQSDVRALSGVRAPDTGTHAAARRAAREAR